MSEASGNPQRIDELVINDDGEAPSLLNPLNGQILITNQVGKRIIELADGGRDVKSIAMAVAQEFAGAEEADILQHAETFLAEGTEKGIVTWTGEG